MKTLVYAAVAFFLLSCVYSFADEVQEGGGRRGGKGEDGMKAERMERRKENREGNREKHAEFMKSLKGLEPAARAEKVKEFMTKNHEERKAEAKKRYEERIAKLKQKLEEHKVDADKQAAILEEAKAKNDKFIEFHDKQFKENLDFMVAQAGKDVSPKEMRDEIKEFRQKQMKETKEFHQSMRKEMQQNRQKMRGERGKRKGKEATAEE